MGHVIDIFRAERAQARFGNDGEAGHSRQLNSTNTDKIYGIHPFQGALKVARSILESRTGLQNVGYQKMVVGLGEPARSSLTSSLHSIM